MDSNAKIADIKAETVRQVASVRVECSRKVAALELSTELNVTTLKSHNAALSRKVNEL